MTISQDLQLLQAQNSHQWYILVKSDDFHNFKSATWLFSIFHADNLQIALSNLHLLSRCTPLENFVSLALVDPEIWAHRVIYRPVCKRQTRQVTNLKFWKSSSSVKIKCQISSAFRSLYPMGASLLNARHS